MKSESSNDTFTNQLIRQILCEPVHWEKATAVKVTHMIDFGPGGASGIGFLTSRNKGKKKLI